MTIRPAILLVISCLGLALVASAQESSNSKGPSPAAYELYSWQTPNGRWRFSILPSPSGVNVSAEQVFNKKFCLAGVAELKRRISELTAGSTIYWIDHIVDAGQTATARPSVAYPAPEMVRDLRNYARTHGVKLEVSANQSN